MNKVDETRFSSYNSPRYDVVDMVPADAAAILELGCSSGATGRLIKERQSALLVGIEQDRGFAEAAAGTFDRVVVADLNESDWAQALDSQFECIIAADVLEHLSDPWSTLQLASRLLTADGRVVISVPNVRHLYNIFQLSCGRWPYRSRGLHDETHLRFFTLRELDALCAIAGLRIERVHRNYRLLDWDGPGDWLARLAGLTPLRDLFAYQYVVLASKASRPLEIPPESAPGWAFETEDSP